MPYEDPARGVAESLPGMALVKRAGQGGDIVLQLLQRMLGQGGTPGKQVADPFAQMSEDQRRAYFAQQGQLGQQMAGREPIQAPASK